MEVDSDERLGQPLKDFREALTRFENSIGTTSTTPEEEYESAEEAYDGINRMAGAAEGLLERARKWLSEAAAKLPDEEAY